MQLPGKDEPTKDKEKKDMQEVTDTRLIRSVTFFGDSALPEDDPTYQSVYEAARVLAENGYAIVNGGGPGIMKAATDGAESVDGDTVGVFWEPKLASFFEGKNLANVTDESETFSNYMIRTLGLIEHGDAYIVCKGGTGTISELGMVWALSKLYYGCHKPVILYGDFWDKLIEAFQETMNIDEIELGVLYQAVEPTEILSILKKHEIKLENCKVTDASEDESAFVLSPTTEMVRKSFNMQAHEYHSTHAGKLVSQTQLDEFMALVHPPAKVLDVGTGPGHDASYLKEKYSVTGIELSKKFAAIAKFENPELEIINADIVDTALPENTYKGIWARNSLHHIAGTDLESVFAKLAAALVEGGILYVIVREGEGEFVEEDVKNYLKLEKFYHLFSEEELIKLAEDTGLMKVRVDHSKRSHKWLIGIFRKAAYTSNS
ncbi:MAG: methyltransferase domain-containing protein [Candidatus Dojkabacteria bacterium]